MYIKFIICTYFRNSKKLVKKNMSSTVSRNNSLNPILSDEGSSEDEEDPKQAQTIINIEPSSCGACETPRVCISFLKKWKVPLGITGAVVGCSIVLYPLYLSWLWLINIFDDFIVPVESQ